MLDASSGPSPASSSSFKGRGCYTERVVVENESALQSSNDAFRGLREPSEEAGSGGSQDKGAKALGPHEQVPGDSRHRDIDSLPQISTLLLSAPISSTLPAGVTVARKRSIW